MRIAAFEVELRERPALESLDDLGDLTLTETPLRRSTVDRYSDVEILSTFIYSDLDKSLLERLPALKLIATRSTGFEHIDTVYCKNRGIAVSNVPSYGEHTVAEHVFALLLAISHRIAEAMERTRRGLFSPAGLQGFDLFGKTLGVVGTGRIGKHVIRIARGFEMKVLAFDRKPNPGLAHDFGCCYTGLDELFAASDVITLHLPSSPDTRHLLSTQSLSRMKDGAVLINTARGDLVDNRGLVQALKSGKLAAAGLDVLAEEPLIREEAELICSLFCDQADLAALAADHLLLRMPNVIVTPHSAFNTREAVERILETTLENIRAFVAGSPRNTVVTASRSAESTTVRENACSPDDTT